MAQIYFQNGKKRKKRSFLINKVLIINHIAFPLSLRLGSHNSPLCNSDNTNLKASTQNLDSPESVSSVKKLPTLTRSL